MRHLLAACLLALAWGSAHAARFRAGLMLGVRGGLSGRFLSWLLIRRQETRCGSLSRASAQERKAATGGRPAPVFEPARSD